MSQDRDKRTRKEPSRLTYTGRGQQSEVTLPRITTPVTRYRVSDETQPEVSRSVNVGTPKRTGSRSSVASHSKQLELQQQEEIIQLEKDFNQTNDDLNDQIEDLELEVQSSKTDEESSAAQEKLKALKRKQDRIERNFNRDLHFANEKLNLQRRKLQFELEEEQDLSSSEEYNGGDDDEGAVRESRQSEQKLPDKPDKDELLLTLMQTQLHIMKNPPEKDWQPEDLPIFNGRAEDWPIFINELIRTTPAGKENSSQNAIRLRKALKGSAKETVAGLLNDPNNCIKIVDMLRNRFGRNEFVLKALVKKAEDCKAPDSVKPETFIEYAISVIQLVESVKSMGEDKYLNDRALLDKLVSKLPLVHLSDWLSSPHSACDDLSGFGTWLEEKMQLYLRVTDPVIIDDDKSGKFRSKRGSAIAAAASTEEPAKKTNKSKDNQSCGYCEKENHTIARCFNFKKLSVGERCDIAKKKGLCFRCLEKSHLKKNCKSQSTCGQDDCNATHHPLLHQKKRKASESGEESKQEEPKSPPDEKTDEILVSSTGRSKPLSIVKVKVKGPNGIRKVYALMDSGATSSVIDADLAKNLGLTGKPFMHTVRAVGGFKIVEEAAHVKFEISGAYRNARYFLIDNAATMKKMDLCPYTQNADETKEKWIYLKKARLDSFVKVVPSVIIGEDYPYLTAHREILERKYDEPMAKRTVLGWVLAGRKVGESDDNNINVMCQENDDRLDQLLKESFSLDSYGIYPAVTQGSIEDQRALQILENTVKKSEHGWECGLLWRKDDVVLPDSQQEAFSRLISNERRMKRDSTFMNMYHDKLLEYEKKGYITKLSPDQAREKDASTFYIPHFGVFNVHKPGKLRLVFDAACKINGESLNMHLLVGPDLIRPLPAVLMNFRRHNVVITGDVEDMFHRVQVRPQDRNSQRFLWRDIRNGETQVNTYVMNVLIFGACSSPSSAIYVMNKNASQYADNYPEAVRVIHEDYYCDDCLTGSENAEKASELRRQICQISAAGNFIVKKWLSNSREVMLSIPEEERAVGAKDFMNKDVLPTEKILGLWWDPDNDQFTFTTNFKKLDPELLEGRRPTKREISSILGSVFDPLGFISNFKIKGMIILQRVWRSGIEWDDKVTDSVFEEWKSWIQQLKCIDQVKVPRSYSYDIHLATDIQLHTLVDASEEATSACCFLRIKTGSAIVVSFVMGKAKVAPIKKVTIPRLELLAAVVGVNLGTTVVEQLKVPINRQFYWSDSRTVLAWIRSETLRYKEFVANRVSRIHTLSSVSDWRWIPTELNVADEATRVKTTLEPEESLWLTGPLFLQEDMEKWPVEKEKKVPVETEDEVRKNLFYAAIDDENDDMYPAVVNTEYFSSFNRLLRAQAGVIRAGKHWLQKIRKEKIESPPWTFTTGEMGDRKMTKKEFEKKIRKGLVSHVRPEDLEAAEILVVKKVQLDAFAVDFEQLQKGKLSKKSSIFKLSPVMRNGLIVLDTRIQNADVADAVKWPMLLPSKHHVTKLLILNEHVKMGHQSHATIFNNLRGRFWIIDGKTAVRNASLGCPVCKLRKVKPVNPKMGNLPPYRLAFKQPPFTYTGADLFGPLEVVVSRHREKRWVVVFTCMVTRAVHMEVVYGLTTDETMMALSRFVDVRGRMKHLFTDNGTNFTGAKKEIAVNWEQVDWRKIMQSEKFQEINWSFSPPLSPHFGGAWEAMVKKAKRVLKATLHDTCPRDQTLLTMLKGAENIINSTPLTFVSSDPTDLDALTANHFLRGFADVGPSLPGDFEKDDAIARAHWRRAQYFVQCFWERWVKEVLPLLSKRQKWYEDTEPVGVGDLVFIVEDNLVQNLWKRGVISATFPGKDGVIRVVEVTTVDQNGKKHVYKRGVDRICPMGIKMGKSE